MQHWAQAADTMVKWTDVVTAVATVAAAVGALLALVFVGLQLRSQAAALDNQRTSSSQSLQVLAEQTKLQTQQTGHVAEQTRLLTQQVETVASTNRAILYQNVTKEMQQINGIFLRSPVLRQYFYDGVPVPHDPELRAQLKIVSEMFVDFIAFTLNTDELLDDDQRSSWARYFRHIAARSPAIQEYWVDHRGWYEPPVCNVLDPVIGVPVRSASDVGQQVREMI